MRKLFNFFFSSYKTQKLILQALCFVVLMRCGLWLLPFKWINKQVDRFKPRETEKTPADWRIVKNVADTVKACSRFVPQASCLTQALATQALLGLRKQSSVIRIGVDKDSFGKLVAHAWVEVEGKIIIGKSSDISRYKILFHEKQQLI